MLLTNCDGLGKQEVTNDGGIDKDLSSVWKWDKHVLEVFWFGS